MFQLYTLLSTSFITYLHGKPSNLPFCVNPWLMRIQHWWCNYISCSGDPVYETSEVSNPIRSWKNCSNTIRAENTPIPTRTGFALANSTSALLSLWGSSSTSPALGPGSLEQIPQAINGGRTPYKMVMQ
uniref:Uncharacterized protein n=1 Tax=Arundo donax TaxID=35708 RepID=A0A0A8XSI7_ARUDO